MPTNRVTLGQIAAHAGVHVTTVSLALRDSPRLPVATRTRLQSLAREMGYEPDPALNALNAYRNQVRSPAYQATIAWFNNYADRHHILTIPSFRDYHAGVVKRAGELGYKLEEIWLHEPGLTMPGVRRRLLARGIRGVLLFPQPIPAPCPAFAWDEFSCLVFGYSVTSPDLHRVTNHQFRSALILLRELRRLGYRRIGFLCQADYDRRVNLGPSSAYAAYDASLPPEERVLQFEQRYLMDKVRFREWFLAHRPEVLITQNFYVWDWLIEFGVRVPEDVGLAYLNLGRAEQLLSGVHQNDDEIGRAATDFLVAMLHRNERGVPAIPQHILIDGLWLPGKTTRRFGPPAPWFLDTVIGTLPAEPETAASTPVQTSGRPIRARNSKV